jgi:hypothetical protein
MRSRARTDSAVSRGATLIGAAVLASVVLVVTFLALGGSSYAPAAVRDPCKPRQWQQTSSLQDEAQQFTLSALDGTACDLHVSRETLVLALATDQGRQRFADDPRLESAVRAGLLRAIDDGEQAGKINSLVAGGLRELAKHAPVNEVIALIEDASPVFGDLGSLLQGAKGLLPDQLQGVLP